MKKLIHLYKIITIVGLSLLAYLELNAQAVNSNNKRGIVVDFQNKRTSQLSNELASNVLVVRNYASTEINFSLNISPPNGWKIVSRKTNYYQVAPGDSIFVPVNIIPQKMSVGNVNHIISVALLNKDRAQFASALWYLNIRKESNWTASAVNTKLFFLNQGDTASFAVKVQNMGNTPEKITLNFSSDKRLQVFSPSNPIEVIKYFNLVLPINTDTVLRLKVRRVQSVQYSFRRDFDLSNLPDHSEIFSLRIGAQSETEGGGTSSKSWRGMIDFIKAGTETNLKEHASATLPLTVEANVDNILESSTMMNLLMYGQTNLERNRSLTYRVQTFFSDNFYDYRPYLGNSHYLSYSSPRSTLEVGDVGGFANFGFTANGKGVKATQRIGRRNMIGAFYLQGPDWISRNYKKDIGAYHEITKGRSSLQNNLQHSENTWLNTIGDQYSNKLRFNLFKFHNFLFSSSISREQNTTSSDSTVSKLGYAYYFNYSGSFKKIFLNVLNSYGSNYNIGYRGIQSIGTDIGYVFKKQQRLTASYFKMEQNPRYISSTGLLLSSRFSGTEKYELRYSPNPLEYGLTLRINHIYSDALNLRTESNGAGFDFRPKGLGSTRFFLATNAAYVKLLDYNLNPYFASQIRASLRHKGFTSNIRYYYGPYQMFEQLLFAKNKINNQSIYTNTNVRLWLKKDIVSFEPSFIYSYETLFKRNRLSVRPEFYYVPKSGFEFRAYGQYVSNNQDDNPFINNQDNEFGAMNAGSMSSSNLFFGFGVRKRIGIPVSGKKYHKLTVDIFKDLNGNSRKDKNELGIKNVMVNIKVLDADTSNFNSSRLKDLGENFVTDGNGQVNYKNLPKGLYRISIMPLSEVNGFFAGNDQIVKVEKDLSYAMPLNQGVSLSGMVAVERDPTIADIEKKIDIGRIRVTALDSVGRSYSTLTDAEGRFNFKLPAGIYQISINEGALPDNFEIDAKRISVEMLTVADNYNITFFVREKKRKINIKKFDQQGKIINSN